MRNKSIDIIVAITLAVLALIAFIIQFALIDDKTTQRETILFNITQFILTVGFTWFGTRAISAGEYEQSLKRFAVGAYRRILDIDSVLNRLKAMINSTLLKRKQCESCAELQIVTAVIDDAKQMTYSSVLDWSDIIGEELIKIQNIKQLEEKRRFAVGEDFVGVVNNKIKEERENIEKKLNELLSSLPIDMRVLVEERRRSERLGEHGIKWLYEMHKKNDGLILEVVTGLRYGDYDACIALNGGDKLHIIVEEDKGINTVNDEGLIMGRVLNISPLSYFEFSPLLPKVYGKIDISAEFISINKTKEKEEGKMAWYTIRVIDNPAPIPKYAGANSQPLRPADS